MNNCNDKTTTKQAEPGQIVNQVRCWLEKVVIALNFCPFANSVLRQGKVRFIVSESKCHESVLLDLHQACEQLDSQPEIETSLLIIPQHMANFDDFNQFLGLAEALLHQNNWSGTYQLAHFHPRYQFSDTDFDDRENWTNRSPYPILHLLRESSISLAVQTHPCVEEIPVKNIECLNNLDDETFSQLFA